MAIRPLMRTGSGEILLPGRVRKTMTWPFMTDTTLPATLTASGTGANGSVTCVDQSSSAGRLTLSSTNGQSVQVSGVNYININQLEAAWWEVEGINLDANAASFGLNLAASGGGVTYNLVAGTMKTNPGGVNTVNVNADATGRRNIGLLILPRYGHVYVTMGDQVISDIDYSGVGDAQGTLTKVAVTPGLYLTSLAGTTSVASVEQMRLTTSSY